jgi:hypothetical protein
MPNYAVIENDKVVNMCVASSEDVKPSNWVLCESGGIDWDYIDGQFVDNRPKPAAATPAPTPTKEQLMTQLAALSAQIQALE